MRSIILLITLGLIATLAFNSRAATKSATVRIAEAKYGHAIKKADAVHKVTVTAATGAYLKELKVALSAALKAEKLNEANQIKALYDKTIIFRNALAKSKDPIKTQATPTKVQKTVKVGGLSGTTWQLTKKNNGSAPSYVALRTFKADGTYVNTQTGRVTTTGKWQEIGPNRYVFWSADPRMISLGVVKGDSMALTWTGGTSKNILTKVKREPNAIQIEVKKLEAAAPRTTNDSFIGTWDIHYTGTGHRHYRIYKVGNSLGLIWTDLRPGRNRVKTKAKLRFEGAAMIVDFGENKTERLNLVNGRIYSEHWDHSKTPIHKFPTVMGIGNRIATK